MWITRHPGLRTRSGAGSMLFNESMQFTKNRLKLEGFSGFKPIEDRGPYDLMEWKPLS